MKQLRFDKNFKKIVDDIPYWKWEEDIPLHIKDYLQSAFVPDVLCNSNTDEYCCFHCMRPLDKNYYCKHCNVSYKEQYDKGNWTFIEDDKEQIWENTYFGYVFDIYDEDIILYDIGVNVHSYYNDCVKNNFIRFQFEVTMAFLINNHSFIDLIHDEKILFEDFYQHWYLKSDYDWMRSFDHFLFDQEGVVYVNNLDVLKNTRYKYTFLWNAKDYLSKQVVSLTTLLFLPNYFSEFEYLMKENLFTLAFKSPNVFRKNKSFLETFGVTKKYLPMIRKYDMSWWDVKVLSIYPTEDYSLLQFFSNSALCDERFFNLVQKYKINLIDLRTYLEKKHYTEYLHEYLDYILLAQDFDLDLKTRKILYPHDLLFEHNKLYLQKEQVDDPLMNKKIMDLAVILSINKYEDDDYIIYPATSVEDLMDEGVQQHNCVCTYCKWIALDLCQIYFMRKKEALKTSFVTIEVRDNKVVQAKAKYNEEPCKGALVVLHKWEKQLIPVVT